MKSSMFFAEKLGFGGSGRGYRGKREKGKNAQVIGHRGKGEMKLNRCFLLLALLLVSGCGSSVRLVGLDSQGDLELEGLADRIRDERVICVGEVHDRLRDHENQLAIITSLHGAGVELAVGLEMFQFRSQPVLDRWNDGSLGWPALKSVYEMNWKLPISMYGDILGYTGRRHIPLLALNIPQNIAARVARSGFSSLTAFERQGLPDTITCDENLPQMVLLKKILAVHGTGIRFANFCEAQALRDKTMALRIVEFLEKHPEKKVVVLAGIGHCAKTGIPAQIRQLSGLETMVILPSVANQALGRSVTELDGDYIIKTGGREIR